MGQDGGKQEEKFDFTLEGEVLGYISLDQARILAMRTARETPGDYGRRFRNANMAFDVVEDTETEDHYVVTLSVRPEGEFTGTPGREQFFIEKEGTVAIRQVLALPRLAGVRRFGAIPLAIALVMVVIAVVIGVVFTARGGGGNDEISAAVSVPTSTPLPQVTSVPLAGAVPTSLPASLATPAPSSTAAPVTTTNSSPAPTGAFMPVSTS